MPAGELFDGYARGYDAALERGLKLSGESRDYFSRGRIELLARELRRLGAHGGVRRILDYGCGTGATALDLLRAFPSTEVVALDASPAMVEEARRRVGHPALRFERLGEGPLPGAPFDLVYASNVFHHIEPARRPEELRRIVQAMRGGGHLALFENNPWNPGARAVMARVPFDRGAVPLSPLEASARLRAAGLELLRVRSLFYFPRLLARLRFLEPLLAPLPLGAQYAVIARKPEIARQPHGSGGGPMSRPVAAFTAVLSIALVIQWSAGTIGMSPLLFWTAAVLLGAGAAAAVRSAAGLLPLRAGEFLCDDCKYNDPRSCSRPERPNATRCPDRRPRGA